MDKPKKTKLEFDEIIAKILKSEGPVKFEELGLTQEEYLELQDKYLAGRKENQ